jgi:hypothetical protein
VCIAAVSTAKLAQLLQNFTQAIAMSLSVKAILEAE